MLDENGKERNRIEGYLPKDEFAAQLLLGLAHVSFMQKKWADAEKLYQEIVEKYPNSTAGPEAVYWKAVSHYKGTNDHAMLEEVPKTLQQKYPNSVWVIAALSGHQHLPTEPWIFEEMMQALQSAVSIQQSAVSDAPSVLGSQPSAAAGRKSMIRPGLEEFTFVDIGSGKGRVLLMAAQCGFKRIIGVELMPEWHRIAEENIRKYAERCTEIHSNELCGTGTPACAPVIESICMDARDFDFPPGPLVVYLFNPFPEPVLAVVLERLRGSLGKNPRPVFLAYRSPEFEPLLQKLDWLEKIAGTEQWTLWRNRRNRA